MRRRRPLCIVRMEPGIEHHGILLLLKDDFENGMDGVISTLNKILDFVRNDGGTIRNMSVSQLSDRLGCPGIAEFLCKFGYLEAMTYGIRVKRFASVHRRRPDINPDIRAAVLNDASCVFCGASENLTIDHIVPVSRGGTDDIDNLQAACRRCNSSKGNSSHDEAVARRNKRT